MQLACTSPNRSRLRYHPLPKRSRLSTQWHPQQLPQQTTSLQPHDSRCRMRETAPRKRLQQARSPTSQLSQEVCSGDAVINLATSDCHRVPVYSDHLRHTLPLQLLIPYFPKTFVQRHKMEICSKWVVVMHYTQRTSQQCLCGLAHQESLVIAVCAR